MNQADIRLLFAYSEWANALVLDAAEALTAEQLHHDFKISYGSIFGTLLHMAGGDWIWCERWQGNSHTGPTAWANWQREQCPDLGTLRTRWQAVYDARNALLERTVDEALQAERSFQRIDGTAGALKLVLQMQHVVNHATLHRGQVVGLIRQLGVTPPATDLLFYLRDKNA